jgi:hypothetical protein
MEGTDSPQNSSASPHLYRSEPALRAAVAAALRANGVAVDEQVNCTAGIADLVTVRRDAVIEVKLWLHRKALHQAVGQLSTYRQAINPSARMIVVGYPTAETAALRPHVEALGVEVVGWSDETGSWILSMEEEVPSARPSPRPQSLSTLRWRVAEHAQSRGIRSVRELSFLMRASRQAIHQFGKPDLEVFRSICLAGSVRH